MARTAKGWQLVRKPSGIHHVRFTLERRRYDVSTRERDPTRAAQAAARIYADHVSGRVRRTVSGALVHPSTSLAVLAAKWLHATRTERGAGTPRVYAIYVRHWIENLPTIGDVVTSKIGDFMRRRLGEVTRKTVDKELTGLRSFLRWLVEQGMLRELPEFPPIPKKATGTRHPMGRRAPVNVLSPAEVEAAIAQHADPDFFIVAWETGLRPDSTLARLERADLTPFGLVIRAECDKNRWARTIPISDRARAALERALPFGPVRRIEGWKSAVRRALGPDREATIYDLKHGRITWWVDQHMPLSGISFLTGVTIETLTRRYAHASRREAETIIRCGIGAAPQTEAESPPKAAGGSRCHSDDEAGSTEKTGGAGSEKPAVNRSPDPGSGAGHQADSAAFRARSATWFRRSA